MAAKFLEAAKLRVAKAAAAAAAPSSQGGIVTVESQETQPGHPEPDPHCFRCRSIV